MALAVAILSGSLLRLNFGIWADRYGGRNLMVLLLLVSAVPCYLVTLATTYEELLICAALFGLAGNSFSVGIAWNSAWFPAESKGTALGVFGAGNVGAAGTKLLVVLVPGLLTLVPAAGAAGGVIPGGWRVVPVIYAALLALMAVAILFIAPKVDRKPGKGRPLGEMLAPMQFVRVWRFSLYYVVVFGAYVALSAWLPDYIRTNYFADLPPAEGLRNAALLTAPFIFPASLLRPLGGYLSDKFGPRAVTYAVFIGMTLATVPVLAARRAAVECGRFDAKRSVSDRSLGLGQTPVAHAPGSLSEPLEPHITRPRPVGLPAGRVIFDHFLKIPRSILPAEGNTRNRSTPAEAGRNECDVLAFVRAVAIPNGDPLTPTCFAAYAAARDESAFEGLLRRHG